MIQSAIKTPEPDYPASLMTPGADFGATYTAVAGLQFSISQMSPKQLHATIRALARVLAEPQHQKQRQAYFLHRKAADTLQGILTGTHWPDIAAAARQVLVHCLSKSGSTALRASAEALGSLPIALPTTIQSFCAPKSPVPDISWTNLLKHLGQRPSADGFWKGRNLVLPLPGTGRVLTIKTASQPDAQEMLHAEGMWMDHLAKAWPRLCDRAEVFTIPQPFKIEDSYVFKITRLPGAAGKTPICFAAGFISHPDYFCYPNEHQPSRPLSNREIATMLGNSAFILGKLASTGIIHTAPIPLFHNRVQRHRRADRGLYQWHRGGRLDRWLASCRFPNMGKTGLRDFEHFIGFNDTPRKLYEYIGTHLLSLVLVAGSCFRNRDASRVGLSADGSPVDARDLFDPVVMKAAVTRIFYTYYQGFTNTRFSGQPPFDLGRLTERLIEEMGVDRYMEEVLRVAEQQIMSDREFVDFLLDRDFLPEEITGLKRGEKDITILTGPHLGAFNSRISLPELTEFAAVSAAVCIGGRYFSGSFL